MSWGSWLEAYKVRCYYRVKLSDARVPDISIFSTHLTFNRKGQINKCHESGQKENQCPWGTHLVYLILYNSIFKSATAHNSISSKQNKDPPQIQTISPLFRRIVREVKLRLHSLSSQIKLRAWAPLQDKGKAIKDYDIPTPPPKIKLSHHEGGKKDKAEAPINVNQACC